MKDLILTKEKNIKTIILALGILVLIASLGVIFYDYSLEKKSVRVTGRVESINYIDGENKATVSFRLTGNEHTATVILKDNSVSVEDQITIKVNMYNPSEEIINYHFYIYIPGLIIAIILIILSLPYIIKSIKKNKLNKRLKEQGTLINATISAVYLNNNPKAKKQGIYPYRLRAKYINPQDQKEYVFESEDTYINLNDPITEYQCTTIAVYLNTKDLSEYFVDLKSLYPPLEIIDPESVMGPKTEIKFRFGTKAEEEYQKELAAKAQAENPEETPSEDNKEENNSQEQ